jgi:hypothetical protein
VLDASTIRTIIKTAFMVLIEAASISETSVNFYQPTGATTQKTAIF